MNGDDRDVARWVRQILFFDVEDGTLDDDESRRILDEVYFRRDAEKRQRQRSRRRRWAAVAGGAVIVAGGATAAAYLWREQPSRPEGGAACRAAAELDADAVVLAPGADPLEGCSEVWMSGQFGDADTVPPLVACISAHGVIEVFPGDTSTCGALGLAAALLVPSHENESIVALQDRLSTEINAAECRPVADVAELAERIVSDTGMKDWRVIIEPGSVDGVCGKTAVDSSTRTVTVHEF